MKEPIKFVTLDGPAEDAKSKFVINEEALRALSGLSGRVGVISIAGLYRTGKSFVLNQLANSPRGFDVGSTVEPCTEGIWMWIIDAKKAHPSLAPADMTIVLLDTEGLGSYQKSTTHDVKIFSLSVLLASYFVYNSIGTIDDSAMDKLSLVVELTKYIRAQSGDNERDLGQLSLYFPKFMWLVRDFSLELIAGGREITPDDYLEKALTPTSGDEEDIVSKNTIRQTIVQAFRDRTCFTLKRPVNDEELLQNLESAKESDFRPEYLEQMRVLTALIYRAVPAKKLYGHYVTGAILANLAKSYVGAINAGGVPTISSAWDSVVRIEGAKALEAALAHYEKTMAEAIAAEPVMETERFRDVHGASRVAAVDVFRTRAIGEAVREFEDQLNDGVAKSGTTKELENYGRSSELCKALLKRLFGDLVLTVSDGSVVTAEALEGRWQGLLRAYEKEAKGPAKHLEFFKGADQLLEAARRVTKLEVAAAEEKAAKKLGEEKEKAKAEYERLEKLYGTVEAEWKKVEEEAKQLKSEAKENITAMAKMEKRVRVLDELEKENGALKARLADLEPKLKAAEKKALASDIAPAPKGDAAGAADGKKKKKNPCVVM